MRRGGATERSLTWHGVVGALAAACLAGGCHSDNGSSANPSSRSTAKHPVAADAAVDPAVAEVNRTMAPGVPLGAGASAETSLDVRFNLASVPAPGETFKVDVAVLPALTAPVLRLAVTGGEGLTVIEPEGPVSFEKVQAGSVVRLAVRASSAVAGTRIVLVRATLDLPGGPESRTFAYPLVVGAQAPPAPAPSSGGPGTKGGPPATR
ncbi:MAG: hypothetical protein JSR73_11715 [Proteobacteria bacterium]|nr:hypothetical protein [Pseudomonadota bacterium]